MLLGVGISQFLKRQAGVSNPTESRDSVDKMFELLGVFYCFLVNEVFVELGISIFLGCATGQLMRFALPQRAQSGGNSIFLPMVKCRVCASHRL